MTNRNWTLLLFLSNRKPVALSLSIKRITLISSLILLLGVGILSLSIHSSLNFHRERKLTRLVSLWAKTLLRMEEMEREVTKLEEELTRWVSLDEKARIISNLEPIEPEIRSLGIGGREVRDLPSPLNPSLRSRSKKLEEKIGSLKRTLEFEKESFREIIVSLEVKKDLLSHTPSIFPVRGQITSSYGSRINPISRRGEFHKGIDIATELGTPVVAPAHGVVTFSGWYGGFGNHILINHGYGYTTRYGHLKEIKVQQGERVRRGEIIGYIGKTGRATGSHLHYEILVSEKPTNPKGYILN